MICAACDEADSKDCLSRPSARLCINCGGPIHGEILKGDDQGATLTRLCLRCWRDDEPDDEPALCEEFPHRK